MDEAISSLAAINTLTRREIEVLKQRLGVRTIDFDYLDNIFPTTDGEERRRAQALTSIEDSTPDLVP